MAHRALLLGCDDGQALQFCCCFEEPSDPDGLGECDVRRMREALTGHQYDVQVVPKDRWTEENVGRILKQALQQCGKGDDFLFYFSGHLRADAGAPQLVLKAIDPPELMSLHWIIERLQSRYIHVRNTYVILDCCYADLVRDVWEPDDRLAIRVLVATDSIGPAKQMPALRCSLFTYCLCEALQDPEHWDPHASKPLVDEDGGIRSDKLIHWLTERIPAVWSKHKGEGAAPMPRAYGGRRGEPFLVARVDVHTGWPLEIRNGLYRALAILRPEIDQVTRAYQHCRALAADHPPLAPLPDGADRRWMLGQLLAAGHYHESSQLKLPLYTFVAHLARDLPEPKPLRDWLDEARRWLEQTCHIKPSVINTAGAPKDQTAPRAELAPYLMVWLEPEPQEWDDLMSPATPDEKLRVYWYFNPDSDAIDLVLAARGRETGACRDQALASRFKKEECRAGPG